MSKDISFFNPKASPTERRRKKWPSFSCPKLIFESLPGSFSRFQPTGIPLFSHPPAKRSTIKVPFSSASAPWVPTQRKNRRMIITFLIFIFSPFFLSHLIVSPALEFYAQLLFGLPAAGFGVNIRHGHGGSHNFRDNFFRLPDEIKYPAEAFLAKGGTTEALVFFRGF